MSSPILNFVSNIDKDFHTYIQSIVGSDSAGQGWHSFLLFITHISEPKSIIFVSIVVVILLILWLMKRPLAVIQLASTLIFAFGVVVILKKIIARVRPTGIIPEDGYSFPSGHALVAAVFFPLIIYTFKHYIQNIWLRRLFILVAFVLMLIIGWSRIYFGVHYLSDVLGGFLIGGLISAISILLMEAHARKISEIE